jgi:hypothetical protein
MASCSRKFWLLCGEVITVIGELQQGHGAARAGDRDAQNLLVDARPAGEGPIPHGPIHRQTQPAREAEFGNHVGDKGQWPGERMDARIMEKAPQAFEAMEEIMFGSGNAAGGGRIGAGE